METKMRAMLSNPMVPEEMKAEVRAMLSQTQTLRDQAVSMEEEADQLRTKVAQEEETRAQLSQSQQQRQSNAVQESALEDDEQAAMEAKARAMLDNPMVPEAMKTQVRQMLAQTQQLRQQAAQAAAQLSAAEEDKEEDEDEQSAMETKMRAMLSNPMVPEEMKAEVRAMLAQTQQLRNQVAELEEDESEDEYEESDEESEEDEESEDESEQAELLQSRMDELAAQRAQLIATKAQLESEILEAQGDLIEDQNQVEEVLAADGSEEQMKVMQEAQTILADPSVPDAMKVEVQAMLSQLTSARSQMFNAAASLSETKKLHEDAFADAEDVDQQQESAGREVALLEQLAQLEGERETMLQVRNNPALLQLALVPCQRS